jgi:hypothetical protein
MTRDKRDVSTTPYNFASLVRGLYGRVARQLDLDPSYVSRVARGERQSEVIESALEREMKRIMSLAKSNHNNNHNHNHANHNGAGKKHAAKKGHKQVHQ